MNENTAINILIMTISLFLLVCNLLLSVLRREKQMTERVESKNYFRISFSVEILG